MNGRAALLVALAALAGLCPSTALGADANVPSPGTPAADAPVPSTRFCPSCGAPNKIESRFCRQDGRPLPPLEPARRAARFVRSPGTYSEEEIRAMVQRATRSVVRIQARMTDAYKYPITWYKDEEAAYWGRGMLGKIETSLTGERLAGSGFVVSADGEIVTNAHVAAPNRLKTELSVETEDGRLLSARVVGSDPASDIALLKVDGVPPLAPLAWGDSSALRTGQETWALGNPLDIGISVARGTLSGMGGMRIGLNQVESHLHSDAHAAPGSSGGPIIDVLGNVIGVTVMGFSEEKGQGYAIPSRMARLVVERLRRDGRYERGFVGLHVRPIDSEAIKEFALARADGTVVESVLPGQPAEKAGFAPGDVILGINGRATPSSYLLQEAVSSVGPGVAITLTLERKRKTIDVPVTTVLRPDAPRIDPLLHLENELKVYFDEDVVKKRVVVRDGYRSRRSPGLYDGAWIKTVLPAQDWPEEPITHNYYKTRARAIPISGRADLREACRRAYFGQRIAMTFEVDNPASPIASVAIDETWPIIL